MTTKEKRQEIEDLCFIINNTYYKPLKAELAFVVDGTNKYSLVFMLKGKRLKGLGQTFYTYDDAIAALKLIIDSFTRAMKEKGGK